MSCQPSNYLSDDYVPPKWQKELAIPSTFECTKEVIASIFAAYDERGFLAPERRTALALAIRQ
ncbi:BQ5605_C006g04313 [Microbotryum silenes-dioicae]|uniref:BQ5605_C006g04313 protein n=1 Tax=Microbotryum silenes-dioicae TaxID=796604 RepID=A0A2X0MAQ9_9BASI|nr:BQ5605_C006g04313 [Microbotryum silenes-dioicae]